MPRHGARLGRAAGAGVAAWCPAAGGRWVSPVRFIRKSLRYARPGHIGRPGDSAAPPQGARAGRARPSPVRRSGRLLRAGEPRGRPAGGAGLLAVLPEGAADTVRPDRRRASPAAGRAADTRVMVEKLFGTDLASAQAAQRSMMHRVLRRGGHTTGSTTGSGLEPVENLLFVRLTNTMIEPLLNRDHVDEHPDHDGRGIRRGRPGELYDGTGAIRDVVQNHMLQVLATVLANPPDGQA